MTHLNRFGTLLITSAALLASSQAQAQVTVLSNLAAVSGGGASVSSDLWWAQGFTSPAQAAGDFSLGSVFLRLIREPEGFAGNLSVSFWNASGPEGLPGAQITPIATVPVSSLTTSYEDHRFDFVSPAPLSPSTPYYIVVSGSANSVNAGVSWADTDVANPGATGSAQMGAWATSDNAGGTWDAGGTQYPLQLALVSAVPEPEFYALLSGLGMLGFAAYRKWRRVGQSAV